MDTIYVGMAKLTEAHNLSIDYNLFYWVESGQGRTMSSISAVSSHLAGAGWVADWATQAALLPSSLSSLPR